MKINSHLYILTTIIFTVYSQLIMRWQVPFLGNLPITFNDKILFILSAFLNPWILSAVLSTFLAGISWMIVMTKFEISYAFPFISINYVIILLASFFIFNEQVDLARTIGSLFVVIGLLIITTS